MNICNTFFNKEASKVYSQLSQEDREQLNDASEVQMSDAEVNQCVRRVTKRVQILVCTKESDQCYCMVGSREEVLPLGSGVLDEALDRSPTK